MDKNFQNLQDNIKYEEEGIVSKVIHSTKKSHVTLFCLSKGTYITEHTSTRQGYVLVLEGRGTFTLKGNPIEMKQGVFISMEPKAAHSIHAQDNTSFLLVLVE